jgi:hypothetical protein
MPDVLTRHSEQVEGDEPEPVGRGRLAGEDGADDRGEVLCRLTVALSEGNEFAVERRARGNVSEGREQHSQPGGEVGAVARPGAYLPLGADIDKESTTVPLGLHDPSSAVGPTAGRGTEHRLRNARQVPKPR